MSMRAGDMGAFKELPAAYRPGHTTALSCGTAACAGASRCDMTKDWVKLLCGHCVAVAPDAAKADGSVGLVGRAQCVTAGLVW